MEYPIVAKYAIKEIDAVLDFFAAYEFETVEGKRIHTRYVEFHVPYQALGEKYDYCNTLMFQLDYPLIISKLIEDGYISIFDAPDGDMHPMKKKYIITFKGKLFAAQGGYGGEINRFNEKELEIKRIAKQSESNDRRNVALTIILAVFSALSAVAAFLQIPKGNTNLTIEMWTSFFLFSCGALSAIAILLIGKEVLNRIKQ